MFASHSYDANGSHAFSQVIDWSCLYTGPVARFALAVSTPMQRDSAQVVPAGPGGGGGRPVQSYSHDRVSAPKQLRRTKNRHPAQSRGNKMLTDAHQRLPNDARIEELPNLLDIGQRHGSVRPLASQHEYCCPSSSYARCPLTWMQARVAVGVKTFAHQLASSK